jgi:KDO2-lipid IV(A) lauroyltransferase
LIVFYVVKLRRDVSFGNLKRSFPGKDLQELRRIEKAFYKHFCDLFMETLKLISIGRSNIKKRFKIKNPEILDQFYSRQKSVILYTAHIGNWEWFACLPLYVKHRVLAFYQPQKNRYFDRLVNILRERFGVRLVESKRGYKHLLELADQEILTLSIIVGDQGPSKESAKQWVTFLSQETAFLEGAGRFAEKFNQVVVFPSVKKVRRGYYEIEIITLHDPDNNISSGNIVESYSNHLESAIISVPEQWLWSHRRWKDCR